MKYFIFLFATCYLLACNGTSESGNTDTSKTNATPTPTTSKSPLTIEPAESPDINITVEGMQAGPTFLIGLYTDQQFRIDSAQMNGTGQVRFKRQEPYPQGLVYVLLPDGTNFQILTSSDQTFNLRTQKGKLKTAMQVEGSVDNELFFKNAAFEEDYRRRFGVNSTQRKQTPEGSAEYIRLTGERDKLIAERKAHLDEIFTTYPTSLFTSFKQAGQNPEGKEFVKADGTRDDGRIVWDYRNRFWDNVDFRDERLLRTPVISNKLKRYITELTPQIADSIVSSSFALVDKVLEYPEYFKYFANWIVIHYDPEETTLMDPQAVFSKMAQRYFTYDRAFWSDSTETYAIQQRAYEMAASLVGNKAPDVKAAGPDGQLRSIYEMKEPYIAVYMFNPECENCAKETPQLVQYYNQHKNNGFGVFAIVLDTDDAKWKAYLAKQGMQGFVNVHDPSNRSIYGKYYVDHTPELYLLNPERIIIAKNLHVNQLETMINRDKENR